MTASGYRRPCKESIERTHVWDTEFRVVWPDGSVHWLLGKGQVFLDDAGRPIRLAGVSLDITERKEAEEALRQSEHTLATELDAAQHLQHVATQLIKTHGTEALYEQILDSAMAILHSDFASIQMFHPERGTNGELRLLGHRGFNAEAAKRWEWVRPTTRTTCGEALCTGRRVVVPDVRNCDFMSGSEDLDGYLGAEIHAGQSTPLVSRSGALLGMVTTYWREPHELSATELRALDVLARMAADLIERSLAEERLREGEQRFRSMADTAPVMIWVTGPDKRATFFNKSCLDFTGHAMEQKLGDGWAAALHPEDREQFLAVFSSSIDARREFRTSTRLRRADGEYRWVLCTGVPRLAPDGTFLGYTGSCLDITDLKRAQEEALARQKLESLGALAGGIAHDFNNLLGGILTEAELVEADLAAGLSPHEEIARIKTVAIRGAEIVRELMTYAGQDQAGIFEPVDLSRLTAEMLELLNVSISKRAVLKINLDKDLPAVWGHAPQIRQVLMNLVINASEAIGDKEGVIQVTTSRVPAEDYVRLEVSDNGCGMTEEAKAKIFDPFFTTKFAGRGLGLAVVQGIVRAHGGVIDVVSAPGRGAMFQVLLPCTPERALEAQNAVISSTAEGSHALTRTGATVLVVEDEEVLRRAVSKALRIKGFSVMEAQDGSVAMDLVRTRGDDIDVILLDVTLPGTSSKEVFEEAQRMRGNLKVVLTSAYDRKTIDAFFPGLRITKFIRKPFQLDELVGTLRDALAVEAAPEKPMVRSSQNAQTLP